MFLYFRRVSLDLDFTEEYHVESGIADQYSEPIKMSLSLGWICLSGSGAEVCSVEKILSSLQTKGQFGSTAYYSGREH